MARRITDLFWLFALEKSLPGRKFYKKEKHMIFRPCIDIHNGKVKQIVGGSLRDEGDSASTNFSSEKGAAFYAELYRKDHLSGGHIILLNPAS